MFAPIFGVLRVVPIWAWALAAVLAWGAFQKHRATSATKAAAVAEQRAAVESATAAIEASSRASEAALNASVQEKEDAYQKLQREARQSAAATRAERERLLNAFNAAPPRGPGSSASAPGRGDGTAELRQMLGSCTQHLAALAEAADDDANRLAFLQQYVKAIGVAQAACAP